MASRQQSLFNNLFSATLILGNLAWGLFPTRRSTRRGQRRTKHWILLGEKGGDEEDRPCKTLQKSTSLMLLEGK